MKFVDDDDDDDCTVRNVNSVLCSRLTREAKSESYVDISRVWRCTAASPCHFGLVIVMSAVYFTHVSC